jgi:diguanylate cyclase
VKFSIDDFGTGYSSLGYLRTLPIHELKIDRSFVGGLRLHERDQTIVRSVIELAARLGLRTVGEGVEDDGSLALLEQLGCDRAQGYRIAPPLPAAELTSWLGARMPGTQGPGGAALGPPSHGLVRTG